MTQPTSTRKRIAGCAGPKGIHQHQSDRGLGLDFSLVSRPPDPGHPRKIRDVGLLQRKRIAGWSPEIQKPDEFTRFVATDVTKPYVIHKVCGQCRQTQEIYRVCGH
jgi:hypothetical protein